MVQGEADHLITEHVSLRPLEGYVTLSEGAGGGVETKRERERERLVKIGREYRL